MLDVIVIGGTTIDIFFKSDNFQIVGDKLQLVHGEKHTVEDCVVDFGGGGGNSSVALTRLGLKVALLGKLGGDFLADQIVGNLSRQGVDLSLLTRDTSLKTAVSCLLLDGRGERTIIMYRVQSDNLLGAAVNFDAILGCKWLYIADLYQTDYLQETELVKIAKNRGVKIAFIPGQTILKQGLSALREFLSLADVFIINKYESHLLMGERPEEDIAKSLSEMGPSIVVITKDKDGVMAYSKGVMYYQKADSIPVVDTTGAGDSFSATFISSLAWDKPIQECLRLAVKNAQAVISQIGGQAGLLSRQELTS